VLKVGVAMRHSVYISFLLGSIALGIVVCVAQSRNWTLEAFSGGVETGVNAEDRIYTAQEVDVRAKITNKMKNLPKAGNDCPRDGMVTLRILLHKSGRVTDVTILKGMGCSYDQATVEVAGKFRFIPAVKDRKQVSQYQIFEYRYGNP